MKTIWQKYKLPLIAVFTVAVAAAVVLLLLPFVTPPPVKEEVTVEAGNGKLSADLFKTDPSASVELLTDPEAVSLRKPGMYTVDLLVGEKNYRSRLIVVDTMAPIAQTVVREIAPTQTLEAMDFVTDVKDVSAVTAVFVTPPPFGVIGEHTVKVKLTDAYQNSYQYETTLRVTLVKQTAERLNYTPNAAARLLKETCPRSFIHGNCHAGTHLHGQRSVYMHLFLR